jgi:TatD DNase family protein
MYSNLIDTHAHIQGGYLYENREKIVEEAVNLGIKRVIVVGTNVADSKTAFEISREFENIFFTVGVHPSETKNISKGDISRAIDELSKMDKCCAIGEIGLDYFRDYSPVETQRRCFEFQLGMAQDLNMPVILHVREAFEDTLSILKRYNIRAVFHCFSGNLSIMEEVISRGYMVSFTGSITYGLKKNRSRMEDVVRNVPLDRFMLETDSPYLSPEPLRGKMNKPSHLIHIADGFSKMRGISPELVEKYSTENGIDFFRI